MRLIDADVAIEELTDRSYQVAKRVGTDSPFWEGLVIARRIVKNLPTIQPEPSIPLSWIDKYIEWLKSLDNEFARLAVAHISIMAKKWRDEQNERTD